MHEARIVRHTLNTIVVGFVGGGVTSSSRKCYVCTVMNVSEEVTTWEEGKSSVAVSFSKQDSKGVLAH